MTLAHAILSRRAQHGQRRAFTLIELLVVIFIIGLLASILIIAVMPLIAQASIEAAARRIQMIESGLADWQSKFPVRKKTGGKGYPVRNEFPDISGYSPSTMTDGQWLRFLLFPTDDELEQYWLQFGVTERVLEQEMVADFLNEAGDAFIDPWDNDYNYKFPGDDHRQHTHVDGKEGINNLQLGKPDIWSYGENGIDDSPRWASVPNQDDSETNDDICNWLLGSYE